MGHKREDLTAYAVLFWPVGAYLIIYRAADAISPSCKMSLTIESAEKPEKPKLMELNRKLVQQVWDDFVPHFNRPDKGRPQQRQPTAGTLTTNF
jgi:hypothetical protein